MERTFHGEVSKDEVLEWIDRTLADNEHRAPRGIAVSNRLHQMGISGKHRGVKIAMDPDLYPDDTVRIAFD